MEDESRLARETVGAVRLSAQNSGGIHVAQPKHIETPH